MFGIGWDVLQPKGNIIGPIIFISAKKKSKIRGSFAMKPSEVHVEGYPCIDPVLKNSSSYPSVHSYR